MGELCEAGSAAPDNHGGCALCPGGLGEGLRRSVPLDLGVGSPEIGRQLPVPVQIPGWRVRQAVADLDMHDKQLRILGPGQLSGLEVITPRTVAYRGALFADFDAPAAIASGADVVLVDELAHATLPTPVIRAA